MLIPTYYLLSKNWDIFATRYCILLIFNPNYFRGGQVKCKPRAMPCLHEHSQGAAFIRRSQIRRIGKDITKHYQMACSSMSYTPFAFYGLMFSMCLFCLFTAFLLHVQIVLARIRIILKSRCFQIGDAAFV